MTEVVAERVDLLGRKQDDAKSDPAPPGFYKMEDDPFVKFEDDIPF